MHLNESNGYWYVRQYVGGEKETVAKLGKLDGEPTIWRPELIQDKAENVLHRLPGDSVDCIISDPPYGVDYESGWKGPEAVASKLGKVSNDGRADFVKDVYSELPRVLKADSHVYIFARWDSYPEQHELASEELDLNTVIVWDKKSHGLGDLSSWAPTHEFVLHYEYGNPTLHGDRPQNVIREVPPNTSAENMIHQTQKPRKLIETLIEKSTRPGETIFDPFGGAYTTARAAMRTFRKAVSCELDPGTHRTAQGLVKKQLRNDPEYGIDWTDVSKLEVRDVGLCRAIA